MFAAICLIAAILGVNWNTPPAAFTRTQRLAKAKPANARHQGQRERARRLRQGR